MLRLFTISCSFAAAIVCAGVVAARHDPAPRMRHVEVGTGVRLHVAESGPRAGRPVLMLHGFSDTWRSWSPILAGLPDDVRAIMPDLRGHGESSRPDAGYAVPALAGDVVALMVRLNLRDVTLVGHSLGSLVAQAVAVQAPDRVARVVLVGSAADPRNPAVLGLRELIASFRDSVPAAFVAEFQRSTVIRPVPSLFLDSVIAASQRMPLLVWRGIADGLTAPPDTARLARLTAPTHLIWGDRDGVFSRSDQDALLRLIPHATLLVYPETGHAPHWEQPERFARDLGALLRARVGRPGPR